MGGFAWVTLATNDSYSLGALVLAHSLKQVGTTKQLAVLITPGVTNAMREKLASVFHVVQEVNILDSRDESNLRLLKRPELGVTFTKLHCWRLTQFDKCVFLDADTLVLQNCDELFDREELSAAPDVGWPDCFNSGVFIYRPSNETYDKLVQFALEKGSFDGGDQGLLNLYFSDWSTKDISKHLPFIYNLCSTACYSYLPAFKQFGALAKIIHFIGASKPWLQYFNTETRKVQPSADLKHLERVLQHWWDIFCNLIHPKLTPEMSGLAGAFAQLTLGAPRTAEQSALDDHLRRQGWEVGNIDYLGRDSFDNIWSKICETLSAGPPAPTPTPKLKANVELPKQEIPPSAPVIAPQETIKDSSVTSTESTIPQAPQSAISEQTKAVISAETSTEAPSTETLQCSLPSKEAQSETVCPLPLKPQGPPVDTVKEITAPEAPSSVDVVQPGVGDQVPQTPASTEPTSVLPKEESASAPPKEESASAPPKEEPASAPPKEEPAVAPPKEEPAVALPKEEPAAVPPKGEPAAAPLKEEPAAAPPKQEPAGAPPKQEPAPAPPKEELTAVSPKETPAPPKETPVPPQETSTPPQESPVPSQEKPLSPAPSAVSTVPSQEATILQPASAPPQETSASPQQAAIPPQEAPATKQETPVPVQEVPTSPKQISIPAQASPPAQEITPASPKKTSAPPKVAPKTPPASKTPEICPLPSQVPPVAAQPPTTPTSATPAPPPTTVASTVPKKEPVAPTTPSKETVVPPLEAPSKKASEPVPATGPVSALQSAQPAPPSAPKEAPKTPEVPSTPPPAVETAPAGAAATSPQAAEAPKGKTKTTKEGTEQQKSASAQGATAASPTPPPRKTTTGGKKTKSKK